MRTIGVTIAVGGAFRDCAEPMLKHWRRLHPDVHAHHVLTSKDFAPFSDAHTAQRPNWLKPHLLDLFPEYDRIVYLDADTFTVAPWLHLVEDEGFDLAAALDPPEAQRQKQHPWRKQFRPDWYFNSGIIVFNRTERTQKLCKMWWELRKQRWTLFIDQDALNRSILNMSAKVQVLPSSCNHILRPNAELPTPGSVNVIHWAGIKNPIRFREMRLMALAAG